jgi:gamma-glutamylcyclotransferase (GGCT)/AIG2-like uncharacterized protein YtfP
VGLTRNVDRPYDFPALIPASGADDRVAVEVYRLADAGELARLDELEAYDPADEAGSEYVRRRLAVRDGPVASAWAWVRAAELPASAVPIPSGDWKDWQRRV